MSIRIISVKFTADQKLELFIENRLKKLMQLYDEIIATEVFLKLENTQNEENKIVEVRLEIKGNDLFAKKQAKSFEEATDNAVGALKRQIEKHKEKVRGI